MIVIRAQLHSFIGAIHAFGLDAVSWIEVVMANTKSKQMRIKLGTAKCEVTGESNAIDSADRGGKSK